MDRTIEVDEVYVTAGLKGRNNSNRASLFRPWLAIHRGVCKDNLSLYLASFKACRKSKGIKPVEVIEEILKIVLIFMAFLVILIRSCLSPKKPQEASHNIFIYEP